jgi:hypothetical protein
MRRVPERRADDDDPLADLTKVRQLRIEDEEEKAGKHQASLDTPARAEKLPGTR